MSVSRRATETLAKGLAESPMTWLDTRAEASLSELLGESVLLPRCPARFWTEDRLCPFEIVIIGCRTPGFRGMGRHLRW